MSLQAPCSGYFREYVPLAWLTTKYITYKKEKIMELSDIDMWEPCKPMNEEEQAVMDEADQIQRGEFT